MRDQAISSGEAALKSASYEARHARLNLRKALLDALLLLLFALASSSLLQR